MPGKRGPPPHERVLSRIVKVVRVESLGECWEFSGYRNSCGYGQVGKGGRGLLLAHRAVFSALVSPIPPGAVLMHECDNPPCVRPEHLRIGDAARNLHDASKRGRMRRGEGHRSSRFTEAQVREIVRMRDQDKQLLREIAAHFGCPVVSVHNVLMGRSWGHVTGRRHRDAMTKVERSIVPDAAGAVIEFTEGVGTPKDLGGVAGQRA